MLYIQQDEPFAKVSLTTNPIPWPSKPHPGAFLREVKCTGPDYGITSPSAQSVTKSKMQSTYHKRSATAFLMHITGRFNI